MVQACASGFHVRDEDAISPFRFRNRRRAQSLQATILRIRQGSGPRAAMAAKNERHSRLSLQCSLDRSTFIGCVTNSSSPSSSHRVSSRQRLSARFRAIPSRNARMVPRLGSKRFGWRSRERKYILGDIFCDSGGTCHAPGKTIDRILVFVENSLEFRLCHTMILTRK